MKLKRLIPMLNITDIEKSLSFYSTALGFEVVSDPDTIKTWKWATLRSGDTELMLSESEGNPNLKPNIDPHQITDWPCIFYFYPDNVEQLYQHVVGLAVFPVDFLPL